jgi:Zn-dependent peptidase ImmA (M78 family)
MHKEITLDSDIDLCEAMAHGFAAEFLVPWETFCKEAPAIPDINHLGPLRRRWKVSMQALVKHMHTNGAISDSAYTNAFKRFAFLGYRRGPEPGWFVPDASVIHTKFLDVVMSKGLSVSNLADNRGISESLLAQFVPDSTAVTSV